MNLVLFFGIGVWCVHLFVASRPEPLPPALELVRRVTAVLFFVCVAIPIADYCLAP